MKKPNTLTELRSFLILWSSQTVSELGTAMTNYALIVWVYGQKGNATSLLVPKEHYTKVGGLQAFSGSAVNILAPALGSFLLAFGGMTVVLLCDLISFAVAFVCLLFLIRIPKIEGSGEKRGEPFLKSCTDGIRYLRGHGALLRLTLFFAVVNFLAKLGGDGMMAPFVLGRSGNDQQALGMVQSAVSLGILAGSLLVTAAKPPKNRVRLIFLTCGLTFLGNVAQSLTTSVALWCAAAFGTYLSAAVMNAHLTALMRAEVPLEMQGRVFSAKDTLQNGTIPLGLFLGGMLADYVFEPFMLADSPLQQLFARCFGAGPGSGIAVIFFSVGVLGSALSFSRMRKSVYQTLNE